MAQRLSKEIAGTWLPATFKFSKTRHGGYSLGVCSGKVAASLNLNSLGRAVLTDPRYQIIRFFSGCFTDLIMWSGEFVIPNKVTIQVFINMSVKRFMSLQTATLAGQWIKKKKIHTKTCLFVFLLFSAYVRIVILAEQSKQVKCLFPSMKVLIWG